MMIRISNKRKGNDINDNADNDDDNTRSGICIYIYILLNYKLYNIFLKLLLINKIVFDQIKRFRITYTPGKYNII